MLKLATVGLVGIIYLYSCGFFFICSSSLSAKMASFRAPNSFENWKQNLQYTLSLDPNFAHLLVEGTVWEKKTRISPLRGFVDDDTSTPEGSRRSAQQKVTQLDLMLGQIANYCPVISRNSTVKSSTSMDSIWQAIKMHFGFHSTGAHFIDFYGIKLEAEERLEDLYQRLLAFADDNLLQQNGGITHHGEIPQEDEEVSPSLENFVVLTWLRLIHSELPKLVKQRYGTELRSRTLASIKPEISQAMNSLLDELHAAADVKIMRSSSSSYRGYQQNKIVKPEGYQKNFLTAPTGRRVGPTKECPLCKYAGPTNFEHFMSTCTYLPEADWKFMTKARVISAMDDHEFCMDAVDEDSTPSNRHVLVSHSPYINTFFLHHPVRVTNMIRESVATAIGAKITTSSQMALQADGRYTLSITGETRLALIREGKEFTLEALVVQDMDVDVLAGVLFMMCNDIKIRPAKRQVMFADGTVFLYGSGQEHYGPHAVRRTQAFLLRAPPTTTTIWPGNFGPSDFGDMPLAIEPRMDLTRYSSAGETNVWPKSDIINSLGRAIRIVNDTGELKVLKRNDHFGQIQHIVSPGELPDTISVAVTHVVSSPDKVDVPISHSGKVCVDPDNQLSMSDKAPFQALNAEYDEVFKPVYSGYNGTVGQFQAVVNMGPVLPP